MSLPIRFPATPMAWWNSFSHLLYPELCVACGSSLPSSAQQCFCFRCRTQITLTGFHAEKNNELTERLWGRLHLETATALYYFVKKGPVQWALHHLKYSNQPEIGKRMGRLLGRELFKSPHYQQIDAIVPVPLHPAKERQRGYNQSMAFALGLAESMQMPVLGNVLARRQFTESQTHKHRVERFQSVGEVFVIDRPALVAGKHILLVDDVLTTGATLESCGNLILQQAGALLSVATIAVASYRS
jgi:ComF family protein